MGRAGKSFKAVLVFVTLAVVCLQALAAGFVPTARAQVAPSGLVAPCPALGGAYNRWHELATPNGTPLPHVASFAQAPCTFVGVTSDADVYRATDARTWRPVGALDGLAEAFGVVSEEMPVGTAFVYGTPDTVGLLGDAGQPNPSGLYVTRDYGATFEPVADLRGYWVTEVAAAPGDPQVLYASASPLLREAGLPLVMKSTDFGRSWTPLPGSLPVRASRIAVDAKNPAVVWANTSSDGETPAPGVWMSSDGGVTFTRLRSDTVVDFDTSPIAGGGSRVDMATGAGIVRTRDSGATFRAVGEDPVAAITHEKFAPDALMAIVSSAPVRSTTAGRTYKPTPGLPSIAGCTVTGLTRNDEFPSHFLLSLDGCGAAGHYVYRSDGRDLLNVDDIGGEALPDPIRTVGRLPRSEMRVLREIKLPVSDTDSSSGSLAFDGELLYYTNNETSNQIEVSTTEGERVRTLTFDPGFDVRTLTFDSERELLWALVNEGGASFASLAYMYAIDPVTGRAGRMFESPLSGDTTLTMDPTMGVFRSYEHHGYGVFEISLEGEIVDRCEVPGFPVDANVSTNPDRGHPESVAPGFASGLAVGDGKMYLQLEDDRTIFHVSKDCEILAVMEHRRFAESRGGPSLLENDQMACDTVTFGQPAIWIRDAAPNTAVAYAVPNGYCPLASKMTLDPPELSAQPGDTVRACAVLLGDGPNGTFMPVGAADVTFFADDVPVGVAVTNDEGRACTSFEAPTGGATTAPVEAAFFGTIAFRPSSAIGSLATTVMAAPPRERPDLPAPPPPPEPPRVALVLPPALPLPSVPAGTVEPPSPPQQPQAQSQQQPQAQAQAGLARQQQQQTQLAFAFSNEESGRLSEEYALSERRDRAARLGLQGAAAVMMLAFGWCATRTSLVFRRVRR